MLFLEFFACNVNTSLATKKKDAGYANSHSNKNPRTRVVKHNRNAPLQKECQQYFYKLDREFAVVQRIFQVQVIEDDKEHLETKSINSFSKTTLKRTKYVRDNRFGLFFVQNCPNIESIMTNDEYP